MQTDSIQDNSGKSASTGVLPIACAILLAALAAYFNSFFGQFVYDDIYITANVDRLWPPVALWSDASAILWATFSINYVLDGFNPVGYHAVNLAIHIFAALALFGILRRTLLLERFGGKFERSAALLAGSIAVLWVVHPLNTQAVTYVIQRRESLMGLLYLLTLYLAMRGFASPHRKVLLALAIATCCLGMRTKPVMVTAPIMVLLYDRIFVARSLREIFRGRWLFYVGLFGAWLLLWPNAPRLAASGVGMARANVSMWDYAMTQFGVILRYLSLTFWPAGQCLEYQWPIAREAAQIAGPAIVVCTLVVLTVWALIRRPAAGYLGAWFFVILAPTSSFIVIAIPIFEHRMYLSLAALIAAVVIGVFLAGAKIAARMSISPKAAGGAGLLLAGVVAAVLTTATINRNTRYYSPMWIWADVLETCPNSERAHYNYAAALAGAGHADRAIEQYLRTVQLDPDFAKAHNNLGLLLAAKGLRAEAIGHYRLAIQSRPEMVSAHYNLGLALEADGSSDLAEASYRKALSIQGDYPQGRNSLGALLYRKGQYAQAAAEYRLALDADPEFVEAMSNLAWMLSACSQQEYRNGPEAVKLAARACEITDYRRAEFIAVLSAAHAETGRFDTATITARKALALIDRKTQSQTAAQLSKLIECYGKSLPWRDSPLE
jgi:protein O-mannosyl-transferase